MTYIYPSLIIIPIFALYQAGYETFDCDLLYDVSVCVTNCDSVNEMTDFFMTTIRACSTKSLEQMVSNMNHHRHLSGDAGSLDRVAETAANTVAVLVMYERGDLNPRVNQLIREREKCKVYHRVLLDVEDRAKEASSMDGAISMMFENSEYNVDDAQSLVTREKSLKWLLNALYATQDDERQSINQIQYSLRGRVPMYLWADGSEVRSLAIDEMQERHAIARRVIEKLSETTTCEDETILLSELLRQFNNRILWLVSMTDMLDEMEMQDNPTKVGL